MLRYRLDDLGAYRFEKLTQSALKALLGLGVESWGNRGDWGRDSYAPGSLRFPDPKVQTDGPFIFQAKFVEELTPQEQNPIPPWSLAPLKRRCEFLIASRSTDGKSQHTLHSSLTHWWMRVYENE
jgi:hypothetical protein